ncbi:sigma-54 interaction domain-containing protein [Sedimentibacter saalensis]|jgi:arginine utilization regulatory protein|uniref:Arginine utilization regulatory protein n=2 Tax=root TaxID=1 RepID=A0A562J3Z3_9FIRM|nr:sigma 54-interacting transcriptional regulator [Sedimentibacter saalensis]MEA5094834.1 sigma 54-interacting transcriptional regulator [Sedimentibacter saalensis]TWH77896.1 arginine utilization regulatory protein [Sedimentibacter saalensis]
MEIKYFDALIQAINIITDGIHIVDASGKIVYYNVAAKQLDEIDVDKAIGRHILEVYPSLSFDTSTILKVLKTGKPIYNVEQNFVNYKGDKISTLNSTLPITYNNKVVGALEVSRNITKVRELSEKIVNLQRELYETSESLEKTSKPLAKFNFLDIIGQNKEMLKLKSLGLKAAMSDSPVMVAGSTGTGKELFVQSIHNSSNRKHKPFIAQNCAALPSNLLESILFGSVKGSFTGAENRPGLFELANGGTLFLDEINSMPLELQTKLLRVLQDGRVRRVGSSNTVDVDVRVISAINTEINEVVESKQLRQDLFFRLNVITLVIPDLCKRKEDIPILVEHFIKKYNDKCSKFFSGISKEVMDIFMEYSWPGNVRELEHAIESAVSLYDGDLIREEHLPFQFKNYHPTYSSSLDTSVIQPLNVAVDKVEREIIISALEQTDYNIAKAAKLINVPRQTLQYKIKKLDIPFH